jgi:hypothetical protein
MGSANSQSENPSVFQYTFTKVHGVPSVNNVTDKLHWSLTRLSLYQVPIDMIAHLARTSHYFLLFDIEFESRCGNLVCHFTEDGVKHLDYYPSRSQAIFGPFEGTYLTDKIEMLNYTDLEGKKVVDLMKAFDEWNKPFNLLLSNCRMFTKFLRRRIEGGELMNAVDNMDDRKD